MQLEGPVDHFDCGNEVQVSSIGISSSGVRNSATTVIESIWVATRIHVQTQGSISQVVEHSSDCGTSGILPPTRNDQGVSGTTLSCVSHAEKTSAATLGASRLGDQHATALIPWPLCYDGMLQGVEVFHLAIETHNSLLGKSFAQAIDSSFRSIRQKQ